VERSHLLHALDRPRRVGLSTETWEAIAVLAGLRVAVNDPIRASDRDRGTGKNLLADVWGVVGELVALRVLNEIIDAPVTHHPISFTRSVDDVDLGVPVTDGVLRLEAKAHQLEPHKKWFMVNRRARDRSARRGAVGYLPVLSALGAGRAIVGRLITINELDGWGAPDRALRDPAVDIELEQLCAEYLGEDIAQIGEALQPGAQMSAARLRELAAGAANDLAGWQGRLPPLDDLSARAVVDAIRAGL
jgi:hypothetical protein